MRWPPSFALLLQKAAWFCSVYQNRDPFTKIAKTAHRPDIKCLYNENRGGRGRFSSFHPPSKRGNDL
ncbi:hypothetical protein HMPREF0262_02039 [Clostridium sp. ATCC 29733]|nr:hypothetical protein HMPREF0262_02039 [Clostridium sp. ATCC 29733]